MAKNDSPYTKRLGKGKERFGAFTSRVCQLWLGPDHVLHIQKNYFSESYKRFYFADIQAVTLCRTEAGAWMNGFLALAVAVMLLLGFYFPVGGDRIATMAAEAALPILLLACNVFLGPTCACRFYTAVQCERITALSRLRKANKAIDILRPLIEARQGVLDEAALSGITDSDKSVALSKFSSAALGDVPAGRYEHCKYHAAFFLLLIPMGVSSAIDIVWQHPAKNTFDGLLFITSLILGIVALRRQSNSSVDTQIRRITWFGVLACQVLSAVVFFSIVTAMTIADPVFAVSAKTGMADIHGVWIDPAFGVFGVLEILTGVLGFMRVREYRARWARARDGNTESQPEAVS